MTIFIGRETEILIFPTKIDALRSAHLTIILFCQNIITIQQLRGLDTVRVSKVKGHVDEDMVLNGRVRGDEAADFGRRRVSPGH